MKFSCRFFHLIISAFLVFGSAQGNTDLKGGIIASGADKDKNSLTTGTLTYSDIQNKSDYKVKSKGGSISISSGKAGIMPGIPQSKSGSDAGTTKATIGDANINITDQDKQAQQLALLNRNTNNTHRKLGDNPDIKQIGENQRDRMDATRDASIAAAKTAGEIATKIQSKAQLEAEATKLELEKARQSGDQQAIDNAQARLDIANTTANNWAEGGTSRTILHAASQAIIGDLSAGAGLQAVGGAVAGQTIGGLAQKIAKDYGIKESTATNLVINVISGLAGYATGGSAGASTATTVDRYNRQLHQSEMDFIKENLEKIRERLPEGIRLAVANLNDDELLVLAIQGALLLVDNQANFNITLSNASDGIQTGIISGIGNVVEDLATEQALSFTYEDNNGDLITNSYFTASGKEKNDPFLFLNEGLSDPSLLEYNAKEFLELMTEYHKDRGGLPLPIDAYGNMIMFKTNPSLLKRRNEQTKEFIEGTASGINEVTGPGSIKGGKPK